MVRFVALSRRAFFAVVATGASLFFCGNLVSAPTAPATNSASAKPTPPATPALPPAAQETLGRFGQIVLPGTEVAHPLRLKLPLPDVGEVKVPKPEELQMREKLEQLASLSDDEIRKQLMEWPPFSKMSLRDEGTMFQRIQDFRTYRTNVAAQKAHDLGLLTLTPDQKLKFEKAYWDQRLKFDEDLARQFQPIYADHEQKMDDQLFRQFSSMQPQPPAPPAPKPAPVAQAQH
jgi:hypothetical protein